ncbi:HPr family phosphocarrier protein [candidate division WOR-3 bacterium]|nr:HPr family phosphocarrier protein [candidate division WOR-3 bacterium]TET97642.1 MAG: HPr family phosphocarrier protein [Candidatus Stahlbacteria bacterium]
MYQKKTKIKNSLGIHARPASMIVKLASKFESKVELEKDNIDVNAKSIMGVLMLASEKGQEIVVRACGEDEKEAVKAIVELIEKRKFDEE